MNLRVSRLAPPPVDTKPSKQDIDRLFEQVSAVFTENAIERDWQLAIPDAPLISISTEINGKKLTLASCHTLIEKSGNYLVTERGRHTVGSNDRAALLGKQSEAFRRNRIAFEKILRLTLERARAGLSP